MDPLLQEQDNGRDFFGFDVHLYPILVATFRNIRARTPVEAINKAEDLLRLDCCRDGHLRSNADALADAEHTDGALVDEDPLFCDDELVGHFYDRSSGSVWVRSSGGVLAKVRIVLDRRGRIKEVQTSRPIVEIVVDKDGRETSLQPVLTI